VIVEVVYTGPPEEWFCYCHDEDTGYRILRSSSLIACGECGDLAPFVTPIGTSVASDSDDPQKDGSKPEAGQ